MSTYVIFLKLVLKHTGKYIYIYIVEVKLLFYYINCSTNETVKITCTNILSVIKSRNYIPKNINIINNIID